jgi:hypothetical protein
MADDHALLKLLRNELGYLNKAGYDQRGRWRAPLIFEDSPTCPNFGHRTEPVPCSECPLAQFIPAELHDQPAACRFIRLNERRQTIDLLYNWGTAAELETAVRDWLARTISELEVEIGATTFI